MENRKPSPNPKAVRDLLLDFNEGDSGQRADDQTEKPTVAPPFDVEAFARDMDAPSSDVRVVSNALTGPPPATISELSQVRRSPEDARAATRQSTEDMRAYLAERDYASALVVAESLLEEDRNNLEAKDCIAKCHAALQDVYLKRIGSLNQVPVLALSQTDLRAAALDNRAGFIVSLMDGVSSLEMILDITGMQPLESLRVVLELVQGGIITLT